MPRRSASRINLNIELLHKPWQKHLKTLPARKLVSETLSSLKLTKPRPEINLVLANDKLLRQLNRRFRKKNKPTNVLSFAAHTPKDLKKLGKMQDDLYLGDIVISFERVLKEAKDQEKTFKNHAAHLIIHGLLHLCGYDHEESLPAKKMETLEKRILARFNIPDPYVIRG
jgi:probable rRNA maturation factor